VTLDDLPGLWPIEAPWRLRETGSGINNLTRFVDSGDRSYFLRVYSNTTDPERVRYEHALLRAAAASGLPFAVPTPIAARSGATFVEAPLAALFEVIPGTAPDRTSPVHAHALGEALGHLHAALERIEMAPRPGPAIFYGTLDRIHPLVPDPCAAVADLPLAEARQGRLRAILADLVEQVPALYRTLPLQLCHCDYGPGNTLMLGDRVTGVIDWEFAGPDLRAIDVATGWHWLLRGEVTAAGWPLIGAFAAGYRAVVASTAAELAAAPTLALLQRATALIHWLGRARAATADPVRGLDQAESLLALDGVLRHDGSRLVDTLAGVNARG
jgi:homoserine kinase type II